MGYTGFSSTDYRNSYSTLISSGATFTRSSTARTTRDYSRIAETLNPAVMKGGVREACFAAGFSDALPIIVSIDATGSMDQVPVHLQENLHMLIDTLVSQEISDHPNVLFMCHDDEHITPNAVFQMSQFETGSAELLSALNEMIIPGQGGGNNGEAYHMAIYAAAHHTRIEAFERDRIKGFFFLIGDEQPYYDHQNPRVRGMMPHLAKEVFGDEIADEIPMIDSLRKLMERYEVFVIRPGHTSHGKEASITKLWADLLRDAGGNPQCVLEIPETEAIIPTMVSTIGRRNGMDDDDLEEVFVAGGFNTAGIDYRSAIAATSALATSSGGKLSVGTASGTVTTMPAGQPASRRSRLS